MTKPKWLNMIIFEFHPTHNLFCLFAHLQTVKNLIWVVCDDAEEENKQVIDLLKNSGIPFQYILSKSKLNCLNKTSEANCTHITNL